MTIGDGIMDGMGRGRSRIGALRLAVVSSRSSIIVSSSSSSSVHLSSSISSSSPSTHSSPIASHLQLIHATPRVLAQILHLLHRVLLLLRSGVFNLGSSLPSVLHHPLSTLILSIPEYRLARLLTRLAPTSSQHLKTMGDCNVRVVRLVQNARDPADLLQLEFLSPNPVLHLLLVPFSLGESLDSLHRLLCIMSIGDSENSLLRLLITEFIRQFVPVVSLGRLVLGSIVITDSNLVAERQRIHSALNEDEVLSDIIIVHVLNFFRLLRISSQLLHFRLKLLHFLPLVRVLHLQLANRLSQIVLLLLKQHDSIANERTIVLYPLKLLSQIAHSRIVRIDIVSVVSRVRCRHLDSYCL
ncbi:hypothetical protein PFISCL1PPCAC_23467 [Pristionchus fissidentatus]|uniref:Uncharacterized protein n=1 Tax=Pristionchus fissidentatus TaxID=1538716 RepID=A0AAV5WNK2_9BILA|nr:hypothetical protein PFISCL1PPCAC_23467 [Pristionchus fissidentatus]